MCIFCSLASFFDSSAIDFKTDMCYTLKKKQIRTRKLMKKNYSFKYFEFTKNYFTTPRKLGHFDLFQAGELEMSENAYIEEHRQVCHEISYILSGEGTFSTEDTELTVHPEDIHIISKDFNHTIKTGKNKGIRFACIGFTFNEKYPHDTLGPIVQLFEECPVRVIHDNGEIGRLFSMLIGELYSGDKYSTVACESIINCILIMTERLFSGNTQKRFLPEQSENFIGQPLYDIIRYIDRTTPNCPGVSDICQSFNYSESYISHLFKEKLGISIRDYIISSKLNYAKLLLTEGKQTVGGIAHILGYGSSRSFCKSFKKQFGLSPSEFKSSSEVQKTAEQDTCISTNGSCTGA